MRKCLIVSLLCLFGFLCAHDGHGHKETELKNLQKENIYTALEGAASDLSKEEEVELSGGRPRSWTQWIGSFHFIFLHFPIALIAMTAVSELLFAWSHQPVFDYSSRFMLISAAILALPTAFLGLTYSYTSTYAGVMADFVWWHMWTGFATAGTAIVVAFIRAHYGVSRLYYSALIFLFLLANITGFLGGEMTLGPYHMYPPL